jgi:hypothetical protein
MPLSDPEIRIIATPITEKIIPATRQIPSFSLKRKKARTAVNMGIVDTTKETVVAGAYFNP